MLPPFLLENLIFFRHINWPVHLADIVVFVLTDGAQTLFVKRALQLYFGCLLLLHFCVFENQYN